MPRIENTTQRAYSLPRRPAGPRHKLTREQARKAVGPVIIPAGTVSENLPDWYIDELLEERGIEARFARGDLVPLEDGVDPRPMAQLEAAMQGRDAKGRPHSAWRKRFAELVEFAKTTGYATDEVGFAALEGRLAAMGDEEREAALDSIEDQVTSEGAPSDEGSEGGNDDDGGEPSDDDLGPMSRDELREYVRELAKTERYAGLDSEIDLRGSGDAIREALRAKLREMPADGG